MIAVDSDDELDDRQSLYANVAKREKELLSTEQTSPADVESLLISSLFVTEKRTYSQIKEAKDTYQIGMRRRKRRQPKKRGKQEYAEVEAQIGEENSATTNLN